MFVSDLLTVIALNGGGVSVHASRANLWDRIHHLSAMHGRWRCGFGFSLISGGGVPTRTFLKLEVWKPDLQHPRKQWANLWGAWPGCPNPHPSGASADWHMEPYIKMNKIYPEKWWLYDPGMSWKNPRAVCDRRLAVELKVKVFKAIVRLILCQWIIGAEDMGSTVAWEYWDQNATVDVRCLQGGENSASYYWWFCHVVM